MWCKEPNRDGRKLAGWLRKEGKELSKDLQPSPDGMYFQMLHFAFKKCVIVGMLTPYYVGGDHE